MDLEHAADPELQPERAEDERVGAFGEHSGAVGGDPMDLHLERAGTAQRAEQLHRPFAAMDRR